MSAGALFKAGAAARDDHVPVNDGSFEQHTHLGPSGVQGEHAPAPPVTFEPTSEVSSHTAVHVDARVKYLSLVPWRVIQLLVWFHRYYSLVSFLSAYTHPFWLPVPRGGKYMVFTTPRLAALPGGSAINHWSEVPQ